MRAGPLIGRSSWPEVQVLYYAALFLLIAIIAGVLGFMVLATAAAAIAKVLFILFFIGAIAMFVLGRRSAE